MARHTTFRYLLDPTVEQAVLLSRHVGAARFAFNHCLAAVKTAITDRRTDPDIDVPWTGIDLINHWNTWKISDDAGRLFAVDTTGVAAVVTSGLLWRHEVSQQVFEEAATDLGRGLKAWSDSRTGRRAGNAMGFPRFKSKKRGTSSFRMRNRVTPKGTPAIRVGDQGIARSVTLPVIGVLPVRQDTRKLRCMIAGGRARILSATVCFKTGHWFVSIVVEAADLHPDRQHAVHEPADPDEWVGIDRGLSAFLVAATAYSVETDRVVDHPKPLAAGIRRQRHLARAVTRKEKDSHNRAKAVVALARHHRHLRNIRHHFLHEVSNLLVKTHDRLVLEDLNIAGMLHNHHLARAISDAGWGKFARQIHYKQAWRGGRVLTADRWFASSRICSACGQRNDALTLSDRVFVCGGCGVRLDRDLNAAVNLAAWASINDSQARAPESADPGHQGLVDGKALAHPPRCAKPARMKQEPTSTPTVG